MNSPDYIRALHNARARRKEHKRPVILRHGDVLGSRNAMARLTEAKVVELRRLVAGGTPVAELCGRYGVSYETARRAAVGRTWRHVPMCTGETE